MVLVTYSIPIKHNTPVEILVQQFFGEFVFRLVYATIHFIRKIFNLKIGKKWLNMVPEIVKLIFKELFS